jgi:carboxylate-amine ligase
VLLLDARTGAAANRVDEVLAALPAALRGRVGTETHACVVELKTGPHATAGATVAELAALRRALAEVLDGLGLQAAGTGTHPLVLRSDVDVSSPARHRRIDAAMRALAHREPTMALHVHVAVPSGDAAVRALDGLGPDLPLLLALSANSPFWRGADTGFASIRLPILDMFPRVGIPRRFGSYRRWARAVEALVASGAIPDLSHLWWDARLQPRLGTVEVRIMDTQWRTADVAPLVALVQCLVRDHVAHRRRSATLPEVLAENRFLAARDGMQARLVDDAQGRTRPAGALLAELVARCAPQAEALGCSAELAQALTLARAPGHARQRQLAREQGLAAVPGRLAAAFLDGDRVLAPA